MSIGLTTVILFAVFGILLFLSCPISVSIVIASIVTAVSSLSWDQITFITMQKMNSGVESFSLLAIPLFILAGNIMNNGGIARRLVNFAKLFVGWIPGSLAQANIVGNMLFGALSGSSVAAASAMGGCIYPIQKDEGYDPAFATAVNIASAPTGLLIPPTSAFIVYSTVAGGVSISTLFMAGYIPGILMGVGSMVVAFIYAKKHKYPVSGRTPMKEAVKVTLEAIPSLLLIIIVIGGIVGGIFTATEGAGICVLYCLILSICYKSLTVKSFMKILVSSACTSGIILFLISASSAMSFVMAYSGIPAAISEGIMSISTNKYVILLLMNIILMVVGMFMDITPAILIFTPIFLPIAQSLGMTDIQFGVMLIFNMCLGNITPPVGSVLFVGCGISKISIEQVTRTLLPYFAVLFLLLMAVTYIPALSLGIPGLLSVYFTDLLALDPVRLTITCILNIMKKFNPFRTYSFLIRAFSAAPSLQHLLQKSSGPVALGILKELIRVGVLHDLPVIYKTDAVRYLPGKSHLMGYQGHGNACMSQVLNDLQNLLYHLRVQGAGGFIKQHNLRLHGQGPGYGNSLLLAAGQLSRIGVRLLHQTHQFQKLQGVFRCLVLWYLVHLHRSIGHIFHNRHMGKQVKMLEHHADILSDSLDISLWNRNIRTVYEHLTLGGLF